MASIKSGKRYRSSYHLINDFTKPRAFRWHIHLMVQVDCLELDKAVFVSMEKLVVCRMSLSLLLNKCKSS